MTSPANLNRQPGGNDFSQTESHILGEAELDAVVGGAPMATVLTNRANMRHEVLKTVANNLRS